MKGTHETYLKTLWSFHSQDKDPEYVWWNKIKGLYSEPDRHYHDLVHIANVVYFCSNFLEEQDQALFFACIFHDAYYRPEEDKNEEYSSVLSHMILTDMGLASIREEVSSLILCTKEHKANSNEKSKYLLDSDLSILASDTKRYNTYKHKIRLEYIHIQEDYYKIGRKAALQQFIDRDRIFYTEKAFQEFEMIARSNITKEIEELSAN